jgi:hypothetical protein
MGRAAQIMTIGLSLMFCSTASGMAEPDLHVGSNIPFEIIAQPGRNLNYPTRVVVIRTAEELAALWRQINPLASVPEVDFRHRIVILYRLGCRPTMCYSVTADDLTVRAGTLYLKVTEHTPGQHCACPALMTCPAVVITTFPWPHAVEAVLNVVHKDCGP